MTQPDVPVPPEPPAPPTTPMPAYPPPYGPAAPYPQGQPAYGYPPAQQAYGYPSVAPYAYPPVPLAPPRKRRVGLIVGLSITAVLVLAAAGVGVVVAVNRYTPVHPVAAPTTSAPASASPTASPTAPPFSGDLRKLLLPVPAGGKTYPVETVGADGTITLAQATKFHFAGSADTDFLKSIGYQRGAWIAWSLSGRSTFLEVDQFLYPSFAQKWLEAFSRDATATLGAAVDVPGEPGAWCQTATKADREGDYDVYCHAYRGDFHVQVDHYSPSAAELDATIQLLRQQLARLPVPTP